jgi:hypothetical protein
MGSSPLLDFIANSIFCLAVIVILSSVLIGLTALICYWCSISFNFLRVWARSIILDSVLCIIILSYTLHDFQIYLLDDYREFYPYLLMLIAATTTLFSALHIAKNICKSKNG